MKPARTLAAVIATGVLTFSPTVSHAAGTSPSAVSLSTPSATSVALNTAVTVSGTVKDASTGAPEAEQRITLQLKASNGWVPQTSAVTDNTGRFTLAVPTHWYGTHTWRAHADGDASHAPADSATTRAVTVTKGYSPAGSSTSYKFISSARWNPCKVIPYWVNPNRMPSDGLDSVKNSMRSVTAATGIKFSYQGATSQVPFTDTAGRGLPAYGVNIAWTTPSQVPALAGSTAGWGGSISRSVNDGPYVFYRGGIALDATWDRTQYPSSSRTPYLRDLIMHETGHVIGLAHVDDSGQVMRPTVTTATRYGAGDLAGFMRLGLNRGCTPY
jgi:hypothetical protein